MKYFKTVLILFLGTVYSLHAQNESDELFMTSGESIAVIVKKVEPNTITYVFSGEKLENVVEKTEVSKIIFKSGREQVFSSGSGEGQRSSDFEHPPFKENKGAVLPFEFVLMALPVRKME